MNPILRYLKTLCTKKQENSYNKALLIQQLYAKYDGRKSVLELKEYVNTLKSEEIDKLINEEGA